MQRIFVCVALIKKELSADFEHLTCIQFYVNDNSVTKDKHPMPSAFQSKDELVHYTFWWNSLLGIFLKMVHI